MNNFKDFNKKYLEGLNEDVKKFLDTGKYEPIKKELTEEEIQRHSLLRERLTIKKWFEDHDYYINKIITGEWKITDTRYVDYLEERKVKRARFDEITQALK